MSSLTSAPVIIFSPDFYESDTVDSSFLEKYPPVVSCEKRLLGFAQNHKIFWMGNAPVDQQYVALQIHFNFRFKIQCSVQGTTVLQLPNASKFWEILPYDYISFVNNQPGLRIVFPLEGQSKGALLEFV